MKKQIFIAILSVFMMVFFTACGDGSDSDNPAGAVAQPDPGDGNENNNGTDTPWAAIRFEEGTDEEIPGCAIRGNAFFTVQENGRYHIESCGGVNDGNLSRSELSRVKQQMRRFLSSDTSTRTCAEAQPTAELYLRATMDNGQTRPIYEELIEYGLCSYGDEDRAQTLYNTFRRLFNKYDVEVELPD